MAAAAEHCEFHCMAAPLNTYRCPVSSRCDSTARARANPSTTVSVYSLFKPCAITTRFHLNFTNIEDRLFIKYFDMKTKKHCTGIYFASEPVSCVLNQKYISLVGEGIRSGTPRASKPLPIQAGFLLLVPICKKPG